MSPPEPRAGLGMRKLQRPHPASPDARGEAQAEVGPQTPDGGGQDAPSVMFSVRVAPSLRRRVKLVAASTGRSVQQLTAEALEALCQRHNM